MGFFFRKRIKILPGLYMNLSKGGVGFSAGVKGCKFSINSKGETYLNAGSGGFYVREKLGNNSDKCNDKCNKTNNVPESIANSEEIQDMVKMSTARAKSYALKIMALDKLNIEGIINDEECEKMKQQIEGGNPQDRNNIKENPKDDILLVSSLVGFILLVIIFGAFLS